jgi:hypothetical protein
MAVRRDPGIKAAAGASAARARTWAALGTDTSCAPNGFIDWSEPVGNAANLTTISAAALVITLAVHSIARAPRSVFMPRSGRPTTQAFRTLRDDVAWRIDALLRLDLLA